MRAWPTMFRTGSMLINPGMELPPGASFDPDPQNSVPGELDGTAIGSQTRRVKSLAR